MSTLISSTTLLWFGVTFAQTINDPLSHSNTNNDTMTPSIDLPSLSTTNQIFDTTQANPATNSSSSIGTVIGALFISAVSIAITILIIKFCVCTDKWRQCSNKPAISSPYNTNKHGPDTTTNANAANAANERIPTEANHTNANDGNDGNDNKANGDEDYYGNDRRVYGSAADIGADIDEEVFRELDKIDSSYPGYTPRTTRGSSVGYIESILERVTSANNEEIEYPKHEEWKSNDREDQPKLQDVGSIASVGSVPEMRNIPKPLRISINDNEPIVVEVITPIETPVLLIDEDVRYE